MWVCSCMLWSWLVMENAWIINGEWLREEGCVRVLIEWCVWSIFATSWVSGRLLLLLNDDNICSYWYAQWLVLQSCWWELFSTFYTHTLTRAHTLTLTHIHTHALIDSHIHSHTHIHSLILIILLIVNNFCGCCLFLFVFHSVHFSLILLYVEITWQRMLLLLTIS